MKRRIMIPADLHAAIKAEARTSGMQFHPLAARLLAEALARVRSTRRPKRAG